MSGKNNDENVYKLVGFLNMFDLVPGFVYPVFKSMTEKTDDFYLQNGENDKLNEFVVLKEEYRSKVLSSGVDNRPCLLTVDSKPIYAFQIGSIFLYGDSSRMIELIQDFKTDDELTIQEIKDFYEEIGYEKQNDGKPQKFSQKDFKLVVSEPNGQFVKISELNEMIEYGAVKIDKQKLKEYVFDSTVMYGQLPTT